MGPAIFRQRYKPQTGQALPDDEGAKKEGNERILRHAPLASFLPKNQVELSVDFRARDYHGAIEIPELRLAHLLIYPMCVCKFLTLLQLQRVSVSVSECLNTATAPEIPPQADSNESKPRRGRRRRDSRDLEGIVVKRKLSIYKDDGQSWLTIKKRACSLTLGRHELLARSRRFFSRTFRFSCGVLLFASQFPSRDRAGRINEAQGPRARDA